MDCEISLTVRGKTYTGWQNLSIKKNLDSVAGSFSFGLKDKWLVESENVPFQRGDAVNIKCGNINMMSGYIDKVTVDDSASSTSLVLSGREKTEDIVDCNAKLESYEFTDTNLFKLATDLCAPFGIKVFDVAGVTGKTFQWNVEQGETVFQTLEKASRKIGVLLISNDDGDLVITDIGSNIPDGALIKGKNVLTGKYSEDFTNRFSETIARGQSNDDDVLGLDPEGIATDSNIERFRPKIILIESSATKEDCQDRAEWETSIALARSVKRNVRTRGWFQSERQMWETNQIVPLTYPRLKAKNTKLLINSVTYSKTLQGTFCDITLVDKDSYIQKKEIEKEDDDDLLGSL